MGWTFVTRRYAYLESTNVSGFVSESERLSSELLSNKLVLAHNICDTPSAIGS